MTNIIELIKKFKDKVAAHYPELYIDFEYDSELNEYDIWHNDPELEFKDEKFKKFIGKTAQEVFFDNNIYNFSFGYDYYKAQELENKTKEYTIRNTKIDKIKVKFFNVDNLNYSNHIAKNTNLGFSQDSIDISFEGVATISSETYLLNITSHTAYNNTFRIDDIKEVA